MVLRHLSVTGADEGHGSFPSEVDFSGVPSGRAADLAVHDTCDAEYGINVFGSRKIDVVDNRGSGFSDSVIYIGGITTTGDGVLRVNRNEAFGSNRGIIVEDSAGGDLRFKDNEVHGNAARGEGDAQRDLRPQLRRRPVLREQRPATTASTASTSTPTPTTTASSTTRSSGNPGGNFFDEGSGNCGSGNHPNPFPPCP